MKHFTMNKYRLRAIAYFLIYLLATPACILLTLVLWLFGTMKASIVKRKESELVDRAHRKSILISGSSQTKALHLCRVLGKAGHRIVITDTRRFRWSGTQYCKYVQKFYSLPLDTPADDAALSKYAIQISKIAEYENIDWFIPVGRVGNLKLNLLIAQEMKKIKPNVRCLTLETFGQGMMLDNKQRFMSECKKLRFRVPEHFRIGHITDLVDLWKQGLFKKKHFFLKPLTPLSEDRVNFRQIPEDQEKFEEYAKCFQGKIRPENPYCACEFIKGEEYSSEVLCSRGEVVAVNINASSCMQTIYEDVEQDEVKKWTVEFCRRLELTGLLSFDFMVEEKTGLVYCIECNPRPHSSIVCFNYDTRLEACIRYVLDGQKPGQQSSNGFSKMSVNFPIVPKSSSPPVYWLYHEITKLFLLKHTPVSFIRVLWTGRDAVYMREDPLPFLFSNTIQMMDLLIQAFVTGKKFSISNHCVGELL